MRFSWVVVLSGSMRVLSPFLFAAFLRYPSITEGHHEEAPVSSNGAGGVRG